MDYLNDFIYNCKAYLLSKGVAVPKVMTRSQKKIEFEWKLKSKISELGIELTEKADNWADLAYKNGYVDIGKLRLDLKNSIRTILREFEEKQRENTGLYN